VRHVPPKQILTELMALERDIKAGIKALEAMVG